MTAPSSCPARRWRRRFVPKAAVGILTTIPRFPPNCMKTIVIFLTGEILPDDFRQNIPVRAGSGPDAQAVALLERETEHPAIELIGQAA